MPTYIHLANLIIDKKAVISKYIGGLEQFRIDYKIGGENFNQEDDQLFSIARMNVDEFNIDALVELGLSYDYENSFSNDFVIRPRYGTYLWPADWVEDNEIFAWHKECDADLIEKANKIAETTMDEIEKAFARGEEPFNTIKR